jgi:hypothetical protein
VLTTQGVRGDEVLLLKKGSDQSGCSGVVLKPDGVDVDACLRCVDTKLFFLCYFDAHFRFCDEQKCGLPHIWLRGILNLRFSSKMFHFSTGRRGCYILVLSDNKDPESEKL